MSLSSASEQAMSMFVKKAMAALSLSLAVSGCGPSESQDGQDTGQDTGTSVEEEEEPAVGFELLHFQAQDELIVWISTEPTQEAFDAIEVDPGWIKNQPREGEPDDGYFTRSPDATEDGPMITAELHGYTWQHNATVVAFNQAVDSEGLLVLNMVEKFHHVGWDAGRTLVVLTSPEGEHFVRISRDANRTEETHALPSGWTLTETVTSDELWIELPNPTYNYRALNEDSYQGPVGATDVGL